MGAQSVEIVIFSDAAARRETNPSPIASLDVELLDRRQKFFLGTRNEHGKTFPTSLSPTAGRARPLWS